MGIGVPPASVPARGLMFAQAGAWALYALLQLGRIVTTLLSPGDGRPDGGDAGGGRADLGFSAFLLVYLLLVVALAVVLCVVAVRLGRGRRRSRTIAATLSVICGVLALVLAFTAARGVAGDNGFGAFGPLIVLDLVAGVALAIWAFSVLRTRRARGYYVR